MARVSVRVGVPVFVLGLRLGLDFLSPMQSDVVRCQLH